MMAQAIRRVWGTFAIPSRRGYLDRGIGLLISQLVQDGGNALDAPFKGVRGGVDGLLGYGHEPDQVGKVADRAAQPARFGEAALGFFGVEYAIRETSTGQGCIQVVRVRQGAGVSQGNDSLDSAATFHDLQAKPRLRLVFHVPGRLELGLYDDGSASSLSDENIGMAAWVIYKGLGVFGAHVASTHHALEQDAKCVVGVGFSLFGHRRKS